MVSGVECPWHTYSPWLLIVSLSHDTLFDHWLEASSLSASPGAPQPGYTCSYLLLLPTVVTMTPDPALPTWPLPALTLGLLGSLFWAWEFLHLPTPHIDCREPALGGALSQALYKPNTHNTISNLLETLHAIVGKELQSSKIHRH